MKKMVFSDVVGLVGRDQRRTNFSNVESNSRNNKNWYDFECSKTVQNTEFLDVPEKKVIRAAKTQKVKIKNSYCQRNGSLDRTDPNRLA